MTALSRYGFPDSDELDPKALVNKMMEYGIFTEGTEVLISTLPVKMTTRQLS